MKWRIVHSWDINNISYHLYIYIYISKTSKRGLLNFVYEGSIDFVIDEIGLRLVN